MAAVGNVVAVKSALRSSSDTCSTRSSSKESSGKASKTSSITSRASSKERAAVIEALVKEHGGEDHGKLFREQVRGLLKQASDDGEEVSDYELDFALKVASAKDMKVLRPAEVSGLLHCWDNYQNSKPVIDRHFEKHDPDGKGYLDKDQLRGLLVELNKGNSVTEEEVAWVLKQSDTLANGVVTKPELRRTLAMWQSYMNSKKACCTVM